MMELMLESRMTPVTKNERFIGTEATKLGVSGMDADVEGWRDRSFSTSLSSNSRKQTSATGQFSKDLQRFASA
jgi:hypothetical protein